MNDSISRQAAIDALGEEPEVWSGNDEYAQGLNNQWHYDVNAIKAVPSAQPELIRCKDCKHFATINEPYNETFCRLCFMNKSEMGYCDKAERRTDAEIH